MTMESSMTKSESAKSCSEIPCLLWNDHQVAVAIGMSLKRVQELARVGLLPSFKVGRNWCFDPEAIRAWVKGSGRSDFNSISALPSENNG
jgi:hypothetical protein